MRNFEEHLKIERQHILLPSLPSTEKRLADRARNLNKVKPSPNVLTQPRKFVSNIL